MVIIVCNPSGFHLIGVLLNGCKFNISDYRREILEPLSEWQREQTGGANRNLIVHADNARPYTYTAAASQEFMEENGLERAIHQPYSPDLASHDFYLFSHVKHCLRGPSAETAGEIFLAIDAILRVLINASWTGFSSIECKDSGNVLKSVVTISKRLKRVSWAKSALRGRRRDVHGSVRPPLRGCYPWGRASSDEA
jgi:hypothetical protein